MKLGILGYVPPPTVGHPETFLANLAQFKCRTDLLLYSDHPWPNVIPLRGSPENLKGARFPDGQPNRFGISNAAFFTGLRIAMMRGYSHVIMLEEDARVGRDDWDQVIWEEFFEVGRPLIAAGTLAVYNPCNYSPEATRRWHELVAINGRRNFPIATYGFLRAGVPGRVCVFPNGDLAVYDVAWLVKLFELDKKQSLDIAAMHDAWDMAIGNRMGDVFQDTAYELVAHLNCVFSGYKDLVTSEAERQEMLTSGRCVAVHQIKSDWKP